MSRRFLAFLCLAASLLVGAVPAGASWSASGAGTGLARTADMPTGATPTVAVTGRSVKVTWAQNAFVGGTIGSRGGGYTVTRYAEGSSTAITPGAGCAGTRTGSADPQTCTEANVPFGRWVYRITPVINTFTGTQGPPSAVAAVVLVAPVLTSVRAQNPATGAANGPIAIAWAASAEATGYHLYRRIAGGSYDFNAPLNGATPIAATSFSDTTATNSTTYDYVVRAINSPPLTVSESSNQLSAKVVTRPPAPDGAVTAARNGGAIDVSWSAVAVAAGYNVYRRTVTGAFDFTQPLNGAAPLTVTTFRDTTGAPTTNYIYVVRSTIVGADAAQVESINSAESGTVSCLSGYNGLVNARTPSDYFRLGEATALAGAANTANAVDSGAYGGGLTFGQPGAIVCDGDTAVAFDGVSGYMGASATARTDGNPNNHTIQIWFRTTTSRGGKLIGLGNARVGASTRFDRHIYMTNTGQLAFGVDVNPAKTILSPGTYRDGKWHLATALIGSGGQRLYVDGVQVAIDPATTKGDSYNGYWRVGYDNLTGAANVPSSFFFEGTLDEATIFPSQLTAAQIAAFYASGRP